MKVGDLVMRSDSLVRESLGRGLVIDSHFNKSGCFFYEVQWIEERAERPFSRAWYEMPELEIISESRRLG